MIVGFTAAMIEFDLEAADRHIEAVRIDQIGFGRRRRQEGCTARHVVPVTAELAELALVDDAVVTVRQRVAVESAGDVLVPRDGGSRVSAGFGVGEEGAAAADVVDVAVGVDQRVKRLRAPAAHRLDDAFAAARAAGVESDETVVGVEQYAVRERLDHRNAVGHRREFMVDPVDGPDIGHALAFVDDGAGKGEQVRHVVLQTRRRSANYGRVVGADVAGSLVQRS